MDPYQNLTKPVAYPHEARFLARALRHMLSEAERQKPGSCNMRFPRLPRSLQDRLDQINGRTCLKPDDQGQQLLGLWELVREGHRPIPLWKARS
jgi:hypothetical protein